MSNQVRVIVAGGRKFVGLSEHKEWLITKLRELKATHIVCGMADGADMFGLQVGHGIGIPHIPYPVTKQDYALRGRAGPHLRNERMAQNADVCILFPGENGTASMRRYALQYNLSLIEWMEP
jgi:predicted Rossmann-fold nucleotide-binding protein